MQYSIWMNSKSHRQDEWKRIFSKLQNAGISNVFLSGNYEDYENVLKYSADFNLKIHAWIFAMICNDEEIIKQQNSNIVVVLNEFDIKFLKVKYVEYFV